MKVLVADDFCPRARVEQEFEKENFEIVLKEIKPLTQAADYSILNFECPVGFGAEKPIAKCGPNLRCGKRGVEAIKYAGFEGVTLANNHFLDYGQDGVENTLMACQKEGLDTVGGGRNLNEASAILYKQIGNQTLAIINCCEHEFSIATETSGGSNPLNPVQQYYAIKEARNKADYVLVIVHGGHEHYPLPSMRMQETYRFFVDAGADAVVNHHQHCFSGYEIYHSKPIFYGLGNFCFDRISEKTDEKWNEGYLVEIEFKNEGTSFSVYPYNQCGENAMVKMLTQDAFDNKLKELNEIINDEAKLKKKGELYYSKSDIDIESILNPFQNHYIRVLQNRGLLPMFISKSWLKNLENYIRCESHREKIEHFMSMQK